MTTSLQIKNSAQAIGLNMIDESYIPDIDFVLDGANQIDSHFNMIKGGGGALLREKIVISAAKCFAIVGHSNKYVDTFKIPIPIEVHPFARSFVLNELLGIGATPKLRMLDKGYPFVTENGNIIYDTQLYSLSRDARNGGKDKNYSWGDGGRNIYKMCRCLLCDKSE